MRFNLKIIGVNHQDKSNKSEISFVYVCVCVCVCLCMYLYFILVFNGKLHSLAEKLYRIALQNRNFNSNTVIIVVRGE